MTRHQGTEKHALIVFYQNLVSSMKLYNIFLKKGILFVKNFRNVIIMDIVSEKFTITRPATVSIHHLICPMDSLMTLRLNIDKAVKSMCLSLLVSKNTGGGVPFMAQSVLKIRQQPQNSYCLVLFL